MMLSMGPEETTGIPGCLSCSSTTVANSGVVSNGSPPTGLTSPSPSSTLCKSATRSLLHISTGFQADTDLNRYMWILLWCHLHRIFN
ncbi:hypothetical protein E2C01_032685 [Portunus trituberculatus]|uniref:Uncharacterized protein n=1 Tax=Portunus trituberculatus TaxID=210409 RepID=A0A5B7EY39_PORTR|nr:hypothetical protein [Portunus trituberculatus]